MPPISRPSKNPTDKEAKSRTLNGGGSALATNGRSNLGKEVVRQTLALPKSLPEILMSWKHWVFGDVELREAYSKAVEDAERDFPDLMRQAQEQDLCNFRL